MALFDPVLIELADHIENPGDSYPVAGTVDAPSYSVGEKEFALDDGISYDVVLTHTGDGVLVTRARATFALNPRTSISQARFRSITSSKSPTIRMPMRMASRS